MQIILHFFVLTIFSFLGVITSLQTGISKMMSLRRFRLRMATTINNGKRELGSLIPDTLEQMKNDAAFIETQAALDTHGQKKLTIEERKARKRSLHGRDIPSFAAYVKNNNVDISRLKTKTLQLNIGLRCNQACSHCHVESSPRRMESMTKEIISQCLSILDNSPSITTVDITGGAPELNPLFRWLVEEARKRGKEVIDRCNLTVLLEPGQEDLAEFLAKNKVRVVASLPCYSEANVDAQRGKGVFGRSILGLQMLNSKGFGMPGSGLKLDLVYNPSGASLPPSQSTLEGAYKEKLAAEFDIQFSNLLTITNMPIKVSVVLHFEPTYELVDTVGIFLCDQLVIKATLDAYFSNVYAAFCGSIDEEGRAGGIYEPLG
jgi:radical SAM/Cys-rich protein